MLYTTRFRYIIFGLILVVSLFFIVWQTGFSQLDKSLFCSVNYLIFASLFVLILLFMRSMLIQRHAILQEKEQLLEQNHQYSNEIDMLRKELAFLQEPLQQEEGHRGAAKRLLAAITEFSKNNDSSKGSCHFILRALSSQFDLCCGLVYLKQKHSEEFCVEGRYAIADDVDVANIRFGEGLSGQVLKDGEPACFSGVPYLKAFSGLGNSQKLHLYILPLVTNNSVVGVVELGSFEELPIIPIWNGLKDELSPMLL